MEKISPWRSRANQFILAASISLLIGHFYGSSITSFRESAGDYMQSKWVDFLDLIGHNDFYLYVIGSVLSIQISFWGVGAIFIYMDLTGRPKWARKYKLQPGKNEPLTLPVLIQTVKVCLFNQWFINTPLFVISYFLKKHTNTLPPAEELPTLIRFITDLFVMTVIDEFGFYYMHRLHHHPRLYSWVHKKHHEWSAPIAIVFVYQSVPEYMMNAIPTTIGPVLLNPHIFTLWSWYILIHLRGLKNHSNYNFPWFPTNEEHDYHHMTSNGMYGKLIYSDWLHGTDKGFRAHMEKKKLKEHAEAQKFHSE